MDGWGDPMNLVGSGPKGKINVRALADGRISVDAATPLSRGDFLRYKDTCKDLGCKFDGKLKAWMCPPVLVSALTRRLQAAGLHVNVEGSIFKVAADRAAEVTRRAEHAAAHVEGMEILYRESGERLYDFQRVGAVWMAGRDRALLADDMGIGKTITALTCIPWEAPAGAIVVCIASVKFTWLEEIAKWRPDLRATVFKGRDSFRWPEPGEVTILNYELLPLLKGERRTKKGGTAKKKGKRIGTTLNETVGPAPANVSLIADECFPAGTLVDTVDGPRPIESIRPGDYVLNAVGASMVRDARSRPMPSQMVALHTEAGILRCTPNHPILTNLGWRPAGHVSAGQYLISSWYAQAIVEDVPGVQNPIPGQEVAPSLLRNELLREMEDAPTKGARQSSRSVCLQKDRRIQSSSLCRAPRARASDVRAPDNAQPDARSRHATENGGDSARHWASTQASRRERARADARRATVAVGASGVDLQPHRQDTQATRVRLSVALQDRCGVTKSTPGNRSRRSLPCRQAAAPRREEGYPPAFIRVDRVEIQERSHLGELAGDSRHDQVYNLEVAGHPSYSVNGVLVHNCHYLKNAKSKRTKRWHGLKLAALRAGGTVWLLSGTPMKNGSPLDLWNVLRAANLEKDAFGSWQGFRDAFDATDVYFGKVRQMEFGTPSPEVPKMLERVMLRRRRVDVLPELPTKRYKRILIPEIDDDTMGLCDDALRILLECGIELTVATREADLSENARAFKALAAARSALAAAKIPAMLDEVKRYEEAGEPLVVFCSHRAAVEVLGTRKGWALIVGGVSPEKRAQIAKDFQAGRYKGIAATIGAGGTGLTYSGGTAQAAHMLMVSRSFSDAENQQAEDRLLRVGNERDSVLITDLVADHELDRRLYELLLAKQKMTEATLPVTK